MKPPFRSAALTALTLTAALAACGGDGGGAPSPSGHPAAMIVLGSFDTTDFYNETSNLMFAVQQEGFPLDTVSAEDSASVAALIAGKDILFLPEYTPTFTAGTQAILKEFVNNGGTIVAVGGYDHLTWLNSAFGWTLAQGDDWYQRLPMPKASGASGTPFADGPSHIAGNDGGSQLIAASLPTGGKVVYNGPEGDTDASVAVIPYGDGRVVYFGWDWYDGAPYGLQDGGWRALLRRTAGF